MLYSKKSILIQHTLFMDPQTIPTSPVETPKSAPAKKPDNSWTFLSTISIIVGALVVAVLVMLFVFRSYQVDGPSMQPTLHHNDRLIIWKVPRTWARITGNPYIPNRGDIIVFAKNDLAIPSNGGSRELIKRVIGLPGDRVVIENGKVTIYNKEHPDGFNPDTTLPYGSGLDLTTRSEGKIDDVVGSNQVYVLGDNRDDSLDSRTFGQIDVNSIVGKLVLRVFPLNDAKRF